MKFLKLIIAIVLFICAEGCKTSQANECLEKITERCICTREYAPVCGCNKKTYANACEATCAGINNYTKGACEESK